MHTDHDMTNFLMHKIWFYGYFAEHDSVNTKPNNSIFEVINFNNVQDDRIGLFVLLPHGLNQLKRIQVRLSHQRQ